jgi:anti-anti-sigma factor
MTATEFSVEIRSQRDLPTLVLAGNISAGSESRLRDAYAQLREADAVVLDFTDVHYINSTGIAVIVGLLAEARKNGQALRARALAEHYREIFRITRLSDFITIEGDEG